jgi:hypothetical protein
MSKKNAATRMRRKNEVLKLETLNIQHAARILPLGAKQ